MLKIYIYLYLNDILLLPVNDFQWSRAPLVDLVVRVLLLVNVKVGIHPAHQEHVRRFESQIGRRHDCSLRWGGSAGTGADQCRRSHPESAADKEQSGWESYKTRFHVLHQWRIKQKNPNPLPIMNHLQPLWVGSCYCETIVAQWRHPVATRARCDYWPDTSLKYKNPTLRWLLSVKIDLLKHWFSTLNCIWMACPVLTPL